MKAGGLLLVLTRCERGVWRTEYVRTGVCHAKCGGGKAAVVCPTLESLGIARRS